MTTEERVFKLQGLLERIKKNASQPRANAPLPPPVAYAAVPPLPAAPPPVAAAAPLAYSPPAPAAYTPPAPVLLDDSVDDLLGLSAEASPPPLGVDIPLDTLPPVAEVTAAPSQVPEAEPIPLVSVAAHESAPPPPVEDTFSLESEVSEVRVAAIPREVEEVTVAAIEAEAEPIVAEELSDDDLVDVTDGTPLPSSAASLDFEDEDERPPASSQRVASTMDEALAAAAAQVDAEREVPLKTPPPESGPQEAPLPGFATAPPAPDMDSLLGDELDIPMRAEAAAPATLAPRPEQLGQTIDLEEARGPTLELAEPAQRPASFAPAEELEVALPEREVAGGYDHRLQPPPEALEELEAHRRRALDDLSPPPESLATLPSMQPGSTPELAPILPVETAPLAAQPVNISPEVVARTSPMGQAESFTSVREAFRPSSFVELLDASLSLGG